MSTPKDQFRLLRTIMDGSDGAKTVLLGCRREDADDIVAFRYPPNKLEMLERVAGASGLTLEKAVQMIIDTYLRNSGQLL